MLIEILYTAIRTVFAFILLLFIARLMGRKAISQMTFFDFCVAITLGSVTANIGFGGDSSFQSAVMVLIILAGLAILTGYFHMKSIT